MSIPDVLGWEIDKARKVLRAHCPYGRLMICETHSRTEPSVGNISSSQVIQQRYENNTIYLVVAFF